jgi:hypothetical protein
VLVRLARVARRTVMLQPFVLHEHSRAFRELLFDPFERSGLSF